MWVRSGERLSLIWRQKLTYQAYVLVNMHGSTFWRQINNRPRPSLTWSWNNHCFIFEAYYKWRVGLAYWWSIATSTSTINVHGLSFINIHVSFIFRQLMHTLDSHFRWRVKNNANLQYLFVWQLSAPFMAMWFNSIGSFVELLICRTCFLGSACEKYEAWKVPLSFSLSLLGQNGFHYVRNHGNQLGRVTSLRFTSTLHDQEHTGKENFDPNLK